jgi:hypothetical protein
MTKKYGKEVCISMLDAMDELNTSQFPWNAEYGNTTATKNHFAVYVSKIEAMKIFLNSRKKRRSQVCPIKLMQRGTSSTLWRRKMTTATTTTMMMIPMMNDDER